MAYDWDTLTTVSAEADGWLNPNTPTVTTRVNAVRDFISLPFGEHKSIAIWVQESPGVYTGTVPNAVYWPSLRLKAAVIDQTRAVAETVMDVTRSTLLSEATSFDNAGTLNLAVTYGPIHAVMLREDYANNSAAFVVSYDWGRQNTTGTTLNASHQLLYCTVTGTTVAVSQTYNDPDQSSTSTYPSILVGSGTTNRAIWFKSKTGAALQTAKVITTSSATSTMTIGAVNDLPVEHTTMAGYLGWNGESGGFIYNGTAASSEVQLFSSLITGSTVVFTGTLVRIPSTASTNVKLLGGQRIQHLGGLSFAAIGVEESFTPYQPPQGIDSYSSSSTYDAGSSYDSSGSGGGGGGGSGGDIGYYDDAASYDEADEYDNADLNGDDGGTDVQVLEPYPRVYVISLSASTFTVQSKSSSGQFYRVDASPSEDIILGIGQPLVTGYQAARKGNALAVVNSAHDAVLPLATTRWFGQEVTFDPITGPIRVIYPDALAPFSGKYVNNAATTSVGLSIASSGAFAFYAAKSSISTSLDRPLRVSYFEHAFATTSTPAFPGTGDPGGDGDDDDDDDDTGTDPDDPGTDPGTPPTYEEEALQVAIERLFGSTSTGTMVCLDGDVVLNGLALNYLDSDGVLWLCTGVEGWWTTPEAATHDHPRGQRDGSYDTDGRYGSRILTVNGVFLPPNRGLVAKARDRLIRAINIARDPGYFRTSDDVWKRESRVWLSGRPEIETVNQKGKTEFSIGLKAPDPIKYEVISSNPAENHRELVTTLSSLPEGRTYTKTYDFDYNHDVANPTGALNVVNYGNDVVYPVIKVTGKLAAGARIRNNTTGEFLTILNAVGLTSVIVIDSQNRAVTYDGAPNMRGQLSVDSDWISLVPGTNSIDLLGTNTGSGADAPPRLTVTWRSGWIG